MSARPARPGSPQRRWAGTCWVLAALGLAVVQVVAQVRSARPYSVRDQTLGDLGVTGCGQFPAGRDAPLFLCSPAHALFDGALVVAGVLVAGGAIAAWRSLRSRAPRPGPRAAAAGLWVLAAAGTALLGLAPRNAHPQLHAAASLAVVAATVAVVLEGVAGDPVASARNRRAEVVAALVTALVSAVGWLLLLAGTAATGVGAGLAQRLAVWPVELWLFVRGTRAVLRR